MKPWVCVGKIIAAHGIKGQIKIKTLTEDPKSIGQFNPLVNKKQEKIILKNFSVKSPTTAVASIDGITTRNEAEMLKGTELFIHQDQFPPLSDEEVYIQHLVDLPLIANGKILGHIIGVYDFGAGSFCEVRTPDGKVGTVHFASCSIFDDKLECEEDHFLI